MRIKHKYLRNKHFWNKSWNRARVVEQPYKTFCPVEYSWGSNWTTEEQIEWHFESITKQARRYVNGSRRVAMRNASSSHRRILNAQHRAKERHAMQKLQNDYDVELPIFKPDAAWNYW